MSLVQADQFFAAAAIETYYANPVLEGHKVKAGDRINVDIGGIFIATRAEEAGWHLHAPGKAAGQFLTQKELEANYNAIELNCAQALPEGAKVEAVTKGTTIVVQP